MAAEDWMDVGHERPKSAHVGRPGYGSGKPWHQRVKTWTSRDGQVTRLRDMEDSHLTNVIAFLRRKAFNAIVRTGLDLARMGQFVHGDNAQDAIDIEIALMIDSTPEDELARLPIYRALCDEADRRAALFGLVPVNDGTQYVKLPRVFSLHEDPRDDGWRTW